MKKMTETEIRKMLKWLFVKFQIQPVPVEIYNGKDAWGGESIKIGLNVTSTLTKVEDVVLHEFAHTLDYRRNGNRKNGNRNIHHDKIFADILQEVTVAWYGKTGKYQWRGEYPAVRKIHKKANLEV